VTKLALAQIDERLKDVKPIREPTNVRKLALAQIDERLKGLDLAEKELVLAAGVGPVLKEVPGYRSDPLVSPFPPVLEPLADPVD
jgi:hypothetical protein